MEFLPDGFEVVFTITVGLRVDFDTTETVDVPLLCTDPKRHGVARGVTRKQGFSRTRVGSVFGSMARSLSPMWETVR